MHTHHHEENERTPSRGRWVLLGFLAVAAYFLWTEHKAHVIEFLPYLLLLACPLMHLFHHHGHGRHSKGEQAERSERGES